MKKENPDFLDWMADRLIQVYGERPNVDFVLALRRIAAEMRMLCTTAAQGAKFSITITGTRDECERAAGAWSSIQKDGGLLPPSTLSAAGGGGQAGCGAVSPHSGDPDHGHALWRVSERPSS